MVKGEFAEYITKFGKNLDIIPRIVWETWQLSGDFDEFGGNNAFITASGSSMTSAMYLQAILNYEHDMTAQLISPQNMQKIRGYYDDVLITISNKGDRPDAYEPARRFKGKTVSFTANPSSRLAEVSDEVCVFHADPNKHFCETASIISCMTAMAKHAQPNASLDDICEAVKRPKFIAPPVNDHLIFLGSHYSECAAFEGMLKATAGMNLNGEWHNIKQYTHDHNTYNWDKTRTIVLLNSEPRIFGLAEHLINHENHKVIEFPSKNQDYLASFEQLVNVFELTYAHIKKTGFDRKGWYKKKAKQDPVFDKAMRAAYNYG